MPGLLARLSQRPPRKDTSRRGRRAAHARRVARRLSDGIDRAMARGRMGHAKILAGRAGRLALGHARLAECLARLRLAEGRPGTTLRIIDACGTQLASLRLLRAACLLRLGAREEAHLELHRFSARSSAPPDARILLALLESRRHDHAAAVRALQRNLRHLQDPRTLEVLVLLATCRGNHQQAQMWARNLRKSVGAVETRDTPEVSVLLESLAMPAFDPDSVPTPREVNALAMELVTYEPAIGTLVEAQKRRPHLGTIGLIRRALAQVLGELLDEAYGCEAMSRLSILLGDLDAARHWAQRGVTLNPMSASLALLSETLQPRPTGREPQHRKWAA